MATFTEKYGPWALITGASAGIGAEVARQLAEHGLNIALVARRTDKLEALSAELQKTFQVDTRVITCDLSQPDFMEPIKAGSDDLDIGLLVNNAGAPSFHGWFFKRSLEEIESVLHFNIHVQVQLTHHFGNRIGKRGGGGIIQVSSIAGHASMPFMAEYSASKGYQIRLTEALNYELRDMNIDTLIFSPSATKTERLNYGMEVEPTVRQALDCLGKQPTIITWPEGEEVPISCSTAEEINEYGDYQRNDLKDLEPPY